MSTAARRFVAQTTRRATIGTFSIDTAGVWTYTGNGSAFDDLNVDDSVSDTFTVKSADGTPTSVQVTITGTNDAAVLSAATINLDETDAALSTGGTLTISDVDSDQTLRRADNAAGQLSATFSIDAAGVWTYTGRLGLRRPERGRQRQRHLHGEKRRRHADHGAGHHHRHQ